MYFPLIRDDLQFGGAFEEGGSTTEDLDLREAFGEFDGARGDGVAAAEGAMGELGIEGLAEHGDTAGGGFGGVVFFGPEEEG